MASSTHARGPAWSRRRFLSTLGVGSALILAGRGGGIRAATGMREYPFTLGVASGEPSPDGFVIWTRLAPDPFVDVAEYPHAVIVDWEIAEDERMTRIVRRGSAIADPEWAHAVHVDVDGLRADRWYWYRFHCDGEASPIGRSRTLPAIGAPMQRLRLAVASCQHFEHGYFSAYRHMLDDDLDLIVHVGDYIYEGSWGMRMREHESESGAVTLADYRNRHACYKRDPDLQAAHAAYPWLLTWDDHEVSNDYSGSDLHDADRAHFATRRAAAYRAYFEHMPLRAWRRPTGDALPLYGRTTLGDLASIHVLDARQYRVRQACTEQGDMIATDCAQRHAREQQMLGTRQQAWLFDGLGRSGARWNVLAQQTLLAPFVITSADEKPQVWSDGWDGYASSRDALLEFIDSANIDNVIALGGDMHAHYVTDLKRDFNDPDSPILATEFVGTSITSQGANYADVSRHLPRNPHVKFFDSRQRGYLRCELTPEAWSTDLRVVDDVTDPNTKARTLVRFHVESGTPGAQQ